MLSKTCDRLAAMDITMEFDENVIQMVSDAGFDPIYGARPLKRFLQKHVETLSAKLILADEVQMGDIIYIDVVENKLTAIARHK